VVERFDYRSEAAFCRTFKRTFGVPSGSVRTAANASVRVWRSHPRAHPGPPVLLVAALPRDVLILHPAHLITQVRADWYAARTDGRDGCWPGAGGAHPQVPAQLGASLTDLHATAHGGTAGTGCGRCRRRHRVWLRRCRIMQRSGGETLVCPGKPLLRCRPDAKTVVSVEACHGIVGSCDS
jgi:hypothetical protein